LLRISRRLWKFSDSFFSAKFSLNIRTKDYGAF
jgi:hypothetical protein